MKVDIDLNSQSLQFAFKIKMIVIYNSEELPANTRDMEAAAKKKKKKIGLMPKRELKYYQRPCTSRTERHSNAGKESNHSCSNDWNYFDSIQKGHHYYSKFISPATSNDFDSFNDSEGRKD